MNAKNNQNEIAGDSILQKETQIHLSLKGAKGKKPLLTQAIRELWKQYPVCLKKNCPKNTAHSLGKLNFYSIQNEERPFLRCVQQKIVILNWSFL